eukprot:7695518-Karenia_brevis.AAC.1
MASIIDCENLSLHLYVAVFQEDMESIDAKGVLESRYVSGDKPYIGLRETSGEAIQRMKKYIQQLQTSKNVWSCSM